MKKTDRTIIEQLAQYVRPGTVDKQFVRRKIDETESALRKSAGFLNNKYKEYDTNRSMTTIMRDNLRRFANDFLCRARPLLTSSEIVTAKIVVPDFVERNESRNAAAIQGIIDRFILETKGMYIIGMYYYHNNLHNNYLHMEVIFLVKRHIIQNFIHKILEINKYYTDINISHVDFINFVHKRIKLESLISETFRVGHHVPGDGNDITGTTANAIKAKAMAKKVSAKEFRLIFPRSSSAQKSTESS